MKRRRLLEQQLQSWLPGDGQLAGCSAHALLIHDDEAGEQEEEEGRWKQVGLVRKRELLDIQGCS